MDKNEILNKGGHVSDRVLLQNIVLKSLSCQGEDEYPANGEIGVKFKANYQRKENILLVNVHGCVEAWEQGQPDKKVVKIDAEFKIFYSGENLNELPDEDFNAFAKTNGVYNAWPYLRELAQSLSVRLGAPIITIPLLRVNDLLNQVAPDFAENDQEQKKTVE